MLKKALVVGDAGGSLETLESVLTRYGFGEPQIVQTHEEALRAMDSAHVDLLVLGLQGVSGLQLAALEHKLRRAGGTFVIATAPNPSPELIVQAMRSGVHEFLVHPPDPRELSGALDRMLRRSDAERTRGQVIAAYSAKGGVGTTTLATNLAFAIAKRNGQQRVAIADLVVGSGDLRVLLDLRPTYDIGDLTEKLDRVDADLLYSLLTPCHGGVWALPGAESPEVEDRLDAATTNAIISHLRESFGTVVLDCEHHLSDRTLTALDAADHILLVTQLNVPALRNTKRTIEICRRLGYPDERLKVIVNRHSPSDVLSISDAAEVMGTGVFWRIPNDYRTSAEALSRGVPVLQLAPDSKLSESYLQLAAKLIGGAGTAANGHRSSQTSRLARLLRLPKRT